MSVVCVPSSHAVTSHVPRQPHSVLVATDFSDTGNAAVAMAYSIVAHRGHVHLVHVVPERGRHPLDPRDVFVTGDVAAEQESSGIRTQLLQLVPPRTAQAQIQASAHVLVASDTAQAICQAAERLGIDVVCVGTHGRSGLSKALLGSIAQSVVAGTTRPVLLVRPPPA
jgi:nucleotide-binding universal stress UspA family protein